MCQALDTLISAHRAAADNFARVIDLDDMQFGPEWQAAEQAEAALSLAICLFRCPDIDSLQRKLTYLATAPSLGPNLETKHMRAILSSMAVDASPAAHEQTARAA